MIQILVALTLSVVFTVMVLKHKSTSGWWLLGALGSCFAWLAFAALLLTIPVSRYGQHDKLAQLQAFRNSVQSARNDKNLSDVERAAILTQIATWNEWLASERYWKGGFWDWWHIDEVLTTQDLR